MKLPAFEYAVPDTLDQAIALLAGDGDAKAIAGGQSLLPIMAYRLAAPSLLVDLRKIPGLDEITVDADGVRLGAKVRWCDIEADPRLRQAHPLLVAAIDHVAHYQIRNRGTVGGSLAHADPSAEMPAIAVACDATLVLKGSTGQRTMPAGRFFVGPLSTELGSNELIVEVRFPPWSPARRWAFEEFSRRRGDFALAGVAVHYELDLSDIVRDAHVGVLGACNSPHRIAAAETVLNGRPITEETILAAGEAASNAVDPPEDLHAAADYRRSLVETLTMRALRRAVGLESTVSPDRAI